MVSSTGKPHTEWVNKQGILFFFFSVIKSAPVDSAAQLYQGAGSVALSFSWPFPHGHELAATAPDIISVFRMVCGVTLYGVQAVHYPPLEVSIY